MEITSLSISGLKLIQLKVFRDERGFFVERFNQEQFLNCGIPSAFVQDNHSLSIPRVLRGLHYQYDQPQAKLVGCISGRIWDVAVDVRKNSPTFGQHYGVELSAENGRLLYIPAGFAHGFCVLGEESADVMYKVDQFYNGKGEGALAWNDPELAIPWPVNNPIVSNKDQIAGSFASYSKEPRF